MTKEGECANSAVCDYGRQGAIEAHCDSVLLLPPSLPFTHIDEGTNVTDIN